jgi:hypothetical protein
MGGGISAQAAPRNPSKSASGKAEARRALLKKSLQASGAECPEKRNLWGRALRSKARWRATPYRRPGGADEAFAVVIRICIVEVGIECKKKDPTHNSVIHREIRPKSGKIKIIYYEIENFHKFIK